MPIEFHCPHCNTRLRVPDGTAGQVAACPKCTQHIPIPHPTPFSDAASPDSPSPPGSLGETQAFGGERPATPPPPPLPGGGARAFGGFAGASPYSTDGTNPYTTPTAETEGVDYGHFSSDRQWQRATVGAIIQETYRAFRERIGAMAILGLIMALSYAGMIAIQLPIQAIIGGNGRPNLGSGLAVVFLWLIMMIVGTFVLAAVLRYVLDFYRGSPQPMARMFDVTQYIPRLIGVNILTTLAFGIAIFVLMLPLMIIGGVGAVLVSRNNGVAPAMSLLLVPLIILGYGGGFWIMARLSFASLFVIDHNEGVFEAFRHSWQYTKGNAMSMIGTGILLYLGALVFTLLTCFIGSVLAFPFLMLAFVVTYMIATGQRRLTDDVTY